MKLNVVEESITSALFELMKKNDYAKITITDIVKKAGVSRVSYYRHFSTKKDVLIRYFDIEKQNFASTFLPYYSTQNWSGFIKELFRSFKQKNDTIASLKKAGLERLYLEYLTEQLESVFAHVFENKYYAVSIAGAVYNTCLCWLNRNFEDSIDIVSEPFVQLQEQFRIKK